MQVIVTLAGLGKRFSEKGYSGPKAAVMVGGRPAITYLMDSFSKDWSLIFVMGEQDRASNLEKIIQTHNPHAKVIYTEHSRRGPIDTVLRAIPFLKPDEGVLVSYCDLAVLWEPKKFSGAIKNEDFAVVNYQGFHPTYLGPNSYCHVRINPETNQVIELQEKKLYTDHIENEITSAGIYYFKNKALLQQALQAQMNQNLKHGNEFYVSLSIQALLNQNENLRVRDYRVQHVLQMGTPEDVERIEFWLQSFLKNEFNPDQNIVERNYWETVFKGFHLI